MNDGSIVLALEKFVAKYCNKNLEKEPRNEKALDVVEFGPHSYINVMWGKAGRKL